MLTCSTTTYITNNTNIYITYTVHKVTVLTIQLYLHSYSNLQIYTKYINSYVHI